MKSRLGIAILFLLVAGLWMFLQSSRTSPAALAEVPSSDSLTRVKADSTQSNSPLAGEVNTAATVVTGATVKPYKPPQPETFSQYRVLKTVVLASPAQEEKRKSILKDPVFLQEVGQFLLDKGNFGDPRFALDENLAVDVLIDALTQGNIRASIAVIQQIVEDSQVEDKSLDRQTRETLAGIKGELLYHASALAPDAFENINDLLPGPVSRKIWQNVLAKQADNLQESLGEKQSFESNFINQ